MQHLVKCRTQSKPSVNAVERMDSVINVWMKLYVLNLLLIVPCPRPRLTLAKIKSNQQCWWMSTLTAMITYWEVCHYLSIINRIYLRSIYIKYLGFFNLYFPYNFKSQAILLVIIWRSDASMSTSAYTFIILGTQ